MMGFLEGFVVAQEQPRAGTCPQEAQHLASQQTGYGAGMEIEGVLPSGSKIIPHLCCGGCGLRCIDLIAQTTKLADHSRRAVLP
jgi:hypothetical protein